MADDAEMDEGYEGEAVERVSGAMDGMSIQEEKVIESKLTGAVGFDSLPAQLTGRALKRPFEFNILLVGSSGLGKSTFVNTLFSAHLVENKASKAAADDNRRTTQIEATTHLVEENGVKLKLSVIDTPGFGDLINNEKSWDPIVKYIQDQYYLYNKEESATVRKRYIRDSRVHLALYFITPSTRGLKPLDIKAMQVLGELVNLVPVIAKADTLTPEERVVMKEKVQQDINTHGIKIYPTHAKGDYEPGELARNAEVALLDILKERIAGLAKLCFGFGGQQKLIPFAVVGSERNVVIDGKAVRGRRNPWGFVSIENEKHCDFLPLRNFVIKTNMLDLIETTRLQHYEDYRSEFISAKKEKKAAKKTTTKSKA